MDNIQDIILKCSEIIRYDSIHHLRLPYRNLIFEQLSPLKRGVLVLKTIKNILYLWDEVYPNDGDCKELYNDCISFLEGDMCRAVLVGTDTTGIKNNINLNEGENKMAKNSKINVQGVDIVLYKNEQNDYISLTDIARYKDSQNTDAIIQNWMRNRNTVELLGFWETIYNPDFKPLEFEGFRKQAGLNSFVLTPKRWIETTNAIGIVSKSGRYGGTFAHKDLALEFASWISIEFKLYLIKEFQRLKEEENNRLKLEWNLQRTLSKINYRIHTDAIKETLIPQEVSRKQAALVYADEADLLNVALFGLTAKEWRQNNPDKSGNLRDYATLEQLVVLSNMESINALLIKQGLPQSDRLVQLNRVAITQMKSLVENKNIKQLK